MKTPYRYILGILAGLLAGLFLPAGLRAASIIGYCAEFSLRLGRYLVLPMIFVTLPVAVTQLRRSGKLGRLLLSSAVLIAISSAVLAALGTLIAWVPETGRLPVIPGVYTGEPPVKLLDILRGVFEMKFSRLLPLVVPAFLLGWHLYHDKEIAEPAYNFFDSLSRIFYRIHWYVLRLMPLMLAFLSAEAVFQARQITDFQRFGEYGIILLVLCVVLSVVVYPLLLRVTGKSRAPWKDFAGMFGALAGVLVSGSPLFNYGNLVCHLKENLNVRRENAGLTLPLYLMFARGGTALVMAFSMITIIRSYSSLEITLFQAAWTTLFSFLVSFSLSGSPDRGVAPALIMLGALYGRGLDDGWLILVPALPLLSMAAAFLDTATGAFLILALNRKLGMEEDDAVAGVTF